MKRIVALVLAVFMLVGLATACSKKATTNKPITACVGSEPKTIDPALNNSVDGGIYINHAFEGLTKVNKDLQIVAGIAESWTMNTEGTEFTFKLRADAKWSDGKDLVADDFVYAWRRAVDPATAAEYAYQLYYIKNGQAINSKEEATADDLATLGVQAVDSKTLKVTLEAPCSYFLQLTAFPTLYPVRQDIVEADPEGWAVKPKTYISDGPYVLTEWSRGEKLVFEKNENYYAKDEIIAPEIDFLLMDDQNAMLAAYKNGDLLFSDDMPTDEIEALKKSGDCIVKGNLGTYFYCFNTEKAPFDNEKVREAFTLAVDRQYLVEQVSKGGQLPASAYVPLDLPDAKAGEDFRKNGGDYYDPTTAGMAKNIERAKQLLSEAGFADGKGLPEIELKYNTSEGHKKIAEYVASEWEKNLGVKTKLANEEWAVFQQSRTDGNFQVARHGWLGDYVDPMTFLDMWTSYSGQNDANWKNTEFDALIEAAKKDSDQAKRMEGMHKAEDLLMKDYAIMPLYFYTDLELVSPKLKGMVHSPLGFKYFMWATIEK